ncbi:MAG: hypothetical protein A2934_00775 [Candidatus Sungbacteria bacterium RIFCSPLOWO2_01_FULL_47_10]|uniref:CN hydrolase domain-containing protein n=1 Tax=Candidatus Sungbacteria bacterium RIFCSPLOWO2_01_FULL_47_10 TaxID=1802276 RepID=A0A1G2KYC8_9BACT|nr:MAG: hypothetical protein A2934_00775 [Candidatus Sungbacteria bacterium RIFCSPLOWO2_01_FULL_47_10]
MVPSINDWERIGFSFDSAFALVNCKDDPRLLLRILKHPEFPSGATVFTPELSLDGARRTSRALRKASRSRSAIRRRTIRQARNFLRLIRPFENIAREKDLNLWIGHYLEDGGKLYNAYSLLGKEGVLKTQRKEFLYKTERWLIDSPGQWNGNFKDYSVLICSEASAFYSPLARSHATRIPELRNAAPGLVVIPAHWVKNKLYLRQTAQMIARRYVCVAKDGFVYEKGVRSEGVVVFVVNFGECYVFGPVDWPDRPWRVSAEFARLKRPGWIEVRDGSIVIKPLNGKN